MNKQYNLDCGYTKKAELQTNGTTFVISRGEDIDERTLYFKVYQNSNTDVVSTIGIEYGWNREFLNKISEALNNLTPTGCYNIKLDHEQWKEYGNIDFIKEVEDDVNQLKIYINIPFKMSVSIILNNAATPEFLAKLSETFAELAEKETKDLVPNFEKWSY
jgi:hypothetical protein